MHVHATYDGTTLTIVITDTQTGKTATQNYPINIPSTVGGNTAYVGFTAGTGGQSAVQDILTWTYGPAAPVSTILPSFADGFAPSLMTLNGDAALSGTRLRLLDGKTDEARSAFFPTLVNVQQFQTSFTFQMTSPTADGIAFVIQAQGPTAVGGYGASLGLVPSRPMAPQLYFIALQSSSICIATPVKVRTRLACISTGSRPLYPPPISLPPGLTCTAATSSLQH